MSNREKRQICFEACDRIWFWTASGVRAVQGSIRFGNLEAVRLGLGAREGDPNIEILPKIYVT